MRFLLYLILVAAMISPLRADAAEPVSATMTFGGLAEGDCGPGYE